MYKHTPGPWHVVNGVQIRSEKHQIAKVWMMRNGEGKANASLISAAPDLLEALQSLLHQYDLDCSHAEDFDRWNEVQTARAAIAKATGERNV